ncbi:formimidoylglutamate deiminase [Rhodovibrio sodomensis]|uniref:Formimidoylglutamate deiminase n=1 Tax=Rhodovibrio sodomensis TaxID=1088 RepID=A0ABS1DKK1_9PROT|nr:formimidoylglutamate deiminase [Rhodovibrio sodomensis]MBK1670253.1 formimidoylglutamate deiminase [Rhodovibrio sodomensis]
MPDYFAERTWLPQGWATDVRLSVDAEGGCLTAVRANADAAGATGLTGPVVPGVPNAHSHAFRRALAGLAERAVGFDGWRASLYRLANALTPEQLEAVTAQAYVELLKAGYTSVAEFHDLHHDPRGRPYRDLPEMAWRVLSAGRHAGMAVTLLPVLYGYGGVGGQAPAAEQRRFVNEPERLLHLIQRVQQETRGQPDVRVGLAAHSLRAVTPETLQAAVDGFRRLDRTAPIHIHLAERPAEVAAVQDWYRKPPAAWLLDAPDLVDDTWTFVHATRTTDAEVDQLAARGVTLALCPTTEANLGVGLFAAARFADKGGRMAVGSDSQLCRDPFAELGWLDHGQRLRQGSRPGLRPQRPGDGPGADLLSRAGLGGRRALGQKVGQLVPGARADLLVLDRAVPALAGVPDDRLLDALLVQQPSAAVRDVMAGGQWRVEDRRHAAEHAILQDYRAAMAQLLPQLG